MNDEQIEQNKQVRQKLRNIEKQIKGNECLLCGKPCTSFCNSHIIPQFILKNIAVNGLVYIGLKGAKLSVVPEDEFVKGIHNAWVCRLICSQCDKKYFSLYEEESKLLMPPKNIVMAQIALKNVLLQIQNKRRDIARINMDKDAIFGYEYGIASDNLDLRDNLFNLRRSKKIIDKELKSGYTVMYYKQLNYTTPIAMQGNIVPRVDLDSNVINDTFNMSKTLIMQMLHICIFPLKHKTIVVLFYHKDDRALTKLHKQFDRLPENSKLAYINYLILKYSESYALSPLIDNSVFENIDFVNICRENINMTNDIISNIMGCSQPISVNNIPNLLDETYKLID